MNHYVSRENKSNKKKIIFKNISKVTDITNYILPSYLYTWRASVEYVMIKTLWQYNVYYNKHGIYSRTKFKFQELYFDKKNKYVMIYESRFECSVQSIVNLGFSFGVLNIDYL